MDSTTTCSPKNARFVCPSFRPPEDQPSGRRLIAGVASLVVAVAAIAVAALLPAAWWLGPSGFALFFAGLFLLRAFRFRNGGRGDGDDGRKLYARNNT